MKGNNLLFGIIALAIGIVWGPQIVKRLPAPVGNFLTLGSDDDVVATVVTSVRNMNDLTVFGAELFVVTKSKQEGLISPLDTTTHVIVPGSVRYIINLSKLDSEAFTWDGKTSKLVVRLPDPQPTDVNIDAARSIVLVDGVDLAAGDTRQRIFQRSLSFARERINDNARRSSFMTSAKNAGRAALTQNFAAPLIAMGLNPTIVIRFKSDADKPALTKG